jgi:hypothetical protein
MLAAFVVQRAIRHPVATNGTLRGFGLALAAGAPAAKRREGLAL